MKTTSTIAVYARQPAMQDAIALLLKEKNPNAKVIKIQKISEAPADSAIAAQGYPQFLGGTRGVKVFNVGLRMLDRDATSEDRKAQYEKVRAEDATIEDILPELGWVEEAFILPGKAYAEAKQLLTEARLNISEAETDEQVLAAYKAGFNVLKDIFLQTKPKQEEEQEGQHADEPPL